MPVKELSRCKNCDTGIVYDGLCRACGFGCVCSGCGRVRQEDGSWRAMHSNKRKVSHGMCEECIKEHYPEFVGVEVIPTAPEITEVSHA